MFRKITLSTCILLFLVNSADAVATDDLCVLWLGNQNTVLSALSGFPPYKSVDDSLEIKDLIDADGEVILFRHIEALEYDRNHPQSIKNTYISYSIHPRFVYRWGQNSYPEGLILISIQNIKHQDLYFINHEDPSPIIASFDRAPLTKLTLETKIKDIPFGEVRVRHPHENVVAVIPYSLFSSVLTKQFKKGSPIPVKSFVEKLLAAPRSSSNPQ